jgi:hypothetical protein
MLSVTSPFSLPRKNGVPTAKKMSLLINLVMPVSGVKRFMA